MIRQMMYFYRSSPTLPIPSNNNEEIFNHLNLEIGHNICLLSYIFKDIRDDIKSFGIFTFFSYLKIEGVGGQRHITEK